MTLKNEEIVGLVDLLVKTSRLRVDDVSMFQSGDMSYRKIEAKIMPETTNVIIRVTYAEFIDSRREVVAFILDDGDWDVFIVPVNHRFVPEFVNSVGVTYDFSMLENSIREQYMYFAENLQLWNLSNIVIAENPDLTDDWKKIDEVFTY